MDIELTNKVIVEYDEMENYSERAVLSIFQTESYGDDDGSPWIVKHPKLDDPIIAGTYNLVYQGFDEKMVSRQIENPTLQDALDFMDRAMGVVGGHYCFLEGFRLENAETIRLICGS